MHITFRSYIGWEAVVVAADLDSRLVLLESPFITFFSTCMVEYLTQKREVKARNNSNLAPPSAALEARKGSLGGPKFERRAFPFSPRLLHFLPSSIVSLPCLQRNAGRFH